MTRPHRAAAVMMTAGAALALAAPAAGAATKTVLMGTPPDQGKKFQAILSDVNAFFPSTITVRTGDSVRFTPVGFHNVDLRARGAGLTPLFSPTGQKVAGATDPAGAPYWFNGQDQLGFTPSLLKSGFGKRFSYDGTKTVQSGLPLANRPKPMTVKFTKAGSFTYLCDVHQGMKGTVKVVGRNARVPSAKADTQRVARQAASALAAAKKAAATTPPAGIVDVGVAGPGGVEHLGFRPTQLTVPRGSTVQFRMTPGTREVHTATSGPGDPEKEPNSFLGKIAASVESPQLDPALAYPSEPPGTVTSLTPTTHGNGFWNTGVLDGARATPPPPAASARFDTPGTYTFYCLIHPFMKGTVTVR